MEKKKSDVLFIVRCNPGVGFKRCGSGAVFLRTSFKAAIKTAKDHAKDRNHSALIYKICGAAILEMKPADVVNYERTDMRPDYWDNSENF